jgi:gamma-F420-2:alpha-L-glutamate ligase
MRVIVVTGSSPTALANKRIGEELGARNAEVLFCHPKRFALTVGTSSTLVYDGRILARPDFVLTRTGKDPHTANVIRHMEFSGLDVANRIIPIQTAVDKAQTMLAAAGANLPIPKTMIVSGDVTVLAHWTDYPAVVKLPTGSCGREVMLVDDASELKTIIQMLKSVDLKRTPIIVQEYMGDRVGVDLRVFVVDGRVIGAMERSATNDGEWRANLAQGGVGKPVEVTSSIAEISIRITNLLGLDIAGVDLLYKGDRYVICEVNSSPGLEIEKHCNVNVAGHIAEFVVNRIGSRIAPKAS